MKLSEAIGRLSEIFHSLGDLDLVCVTEVDGAFAVEKGRTFDVIELGKDDGTFDPPVAAFLEEECPYCKEEREPPKPKLRIVKGET